MAEPAYGLTLGAIRALTPIVQQHKGRLPDAGRRTRKVYPQSTRFARYRITQLDESDNPVVIYRTSHADGFDAVRLDNDDDVATGPTTTIYATSRSVRSVFSTNDIVWARVVDGKVQIVDHGRTHWTGIALEDIAPESSGDVTLYSGENITASALNWSANQYVATDDEVRVEWEDEFQRFLIVAVKCSEIV